MTAWVRKLIALVVVATASAAEPAIPAVRLIDWTPGTYTGVPGGIPTNRTMYVNAKTGELGAGGTYGGTLAAGDGTTDDTSAIMAMIAACPEGQYVYLPASTYKITTIYIGNSSTQNNRTLRGAGPTTILESSTSSQAFVIGPSNGFVVPSGTAESLLIPTAGVFKGSDTLTLPSGGTTNLSLGQLIRFTEDIDEAVPHVSVFGYRHLVGQNVRITGKTATTVTFFPELYQDYGSGAIETRIRAAASKVLGVGIEDLHVKLTNNGQTGIYLVQADSCWIKGVSVEDAVNYPFWIQDSLQVEVRRNIAMPRNGSGTSGGGILVQQTSGALVEDNIVYDNWISEIMVNFGSSGNAFSRNFTTGPHMIGTNHAPHNTFNLWEGNVTSGFKSDGYFGGEQWALFFNNKTKFVSAYRFSREFTLVGNFITGLGSYGGHPGDLGTPFFGNGNYFVGTASWYAGNYTDDWAERIVTGTVTGHTKGTGTGYLVNNVGGYAQGETVINLDSGSGTILAGDIVKFGSSPYRYRVVSFSGGVLTIDSNSVFTTGLWTSISDNDPVTVTTDKITVSYTGPNSPQLRGYNGNDRMVVAFTWNSYANNQLYKIDTENAGVIEVIGFTDVNAGDAPDVGTGIEIGVGQDQSVLDEKDLGVEATLFLAGNRYTQTGDLDSMAGATMPQSYMYGAKPPWLTGAETEFSTTFNLRPFDPITGTAPSDSDIPAGYRYTYTLPPAFASASINALGTELSVAINKPMFVGAGGSPSAELSGGVTGTFNRIEGSALIFSTSRTITEGETLTVSLTNVANGYEDVNGNDLPNFSSQAVTNASSATSGVVHIGPDVADMTTDYDYPDSGMILLQKVTASANGTALAVRFYIENNTYAAAFRAVVTNMSGTVLSTSTSNGTVTGTDRWQSIPVTSFSVVSGTSYLVGVQFLANGDPKMRSLPAQAAGSSYSHNSTPFLTALPSSLTPENASTTEYALQLRIAPTPPLYTPGRLRALFR